MRHERGFPVGSETMSCPVPGTGHRTVGKAAERALGAPLGTACHVSGTGLNLAGLVGVMGGWRRALGQSDPCQRTSSSHAGRVRSEDRQLAARQAGRPAQLADRPYETRRPRRSRRRHGRADRARRAIAAASSRRGTVDAVICAATSRPPDASMTASISKPSGSRRGRAPRACLTRGAASQSRRWRTIRPAAPLTDPAAARGRRHPCR